MSEDAPNADDEARRGRSAVDGDLWMILITGLACILNIVALFVTSGHYETFGYFACGWFLFGTGAFVWQLFSGRFHWFIVLSVAACSAVAFSINGHFLAAITASV